MLSGEIPHAGLTVAICVLPTYELIVRVSPLPVPDEIEIVKPAYKSSLVLDAVASVIVLAPPA